MKPLIAICTVATVCLGACSSEPVKRDDAPRVSPSNNGRFQNGPAPNGTPRLFPGEEWTGEKAANARAAQEVDFHPNPDEPITVDFVQKVPTFGYNPVEGLERMPFGGGMFGPWDVGGIGPGHPLSGNGEWLPPGKDLHTVMHFLALRTGLQIIVEGDLDLKLSVGFKTPANKAEAIAAIQTVCKASKLDFIQDGDVIIIKKRPLETPLAKWTFGDVDGTYNVVFEDQELFSAILEVANAMNVQVFLPARRPEDDDEDAGGTSGGPIFDIPKVTLTMKKSTPEEILRELARLGNMDIEVIPLNEDDPSQGIGYKFDWKK